MFEYVLYCSRSLVVLFKKRMPGCFSGGVALLMGTKDVSRLLSTGEGCLIHLYSFLSSELSTEQRRWRCKIGIDETTTWSAHVYEDTCGDSVQDKHTCINTHVMYST